MDRVNQSKNDVSRLSLTLLEYQVGYGEPGLRGNLGYHGLPVTVRQRCSAQRCALTRLAPGRENEP